MAETPYMMAIFLWSTVVTQLRQPVSDVGRLKTPIGSARSPPSPSSSCPLRSMSAIGSRLSLLQTGKVGHQIIDLGLGQVQVRHTPFLLRIHRNLGRRIPEPRL